MMIWAAFSAVIRASFFSKKESIDSASWLGGLAAVAGDAGLDAAGVHAGDGDVVAVDQHLLAQRLGEAADGVLGGVVRRLARAC